MLVSVIIPVYNVSEYLEICLDSIVNQTYKDLQIIIVNDGSADNSAEIAKGFADRDKRIQLIHQENKGVSVARNNGMKNAKGKYLFFVDADDRITSNAVELLINRIKNDDTDLVCAGYYEVNLQFPKGLKLNDFTKEQQDTIINQSDFQKNLFNGVSGVLWAKLFRREFFENYNLCLNPEINFSEDLLLVIEYSFYVKKVSVISDSIYYYNRLNEFGLSRKLKESNINDLKLTNQKILEFSDKLKSLDIIEIIKNREINFLIQYLKQNITNYQSFRKAINHVYMHFDSDLIKLAYKKSNCNYFLTLIKYKIYYLSYILLKSEEILKKLKQKILS